MNETINLSQRAYLCVKEGQAVSVKLLDVAYTGPNMLSARLELARSVVPNVEPNIYVKHVGTAPIHGRICWQSVLESNGSANLL